MIDYLIVGAGLFGSIVANELHKAGKSVVVVEKRNHIGGTIYTEYKDNIHIHKYGAHIFRTDDKEIWDYVNNIVPLRNFVNCPMAMYHNQLYNLPFNMNTFNEIWGAKTPEEARERIKETIVESNGNDLESWAKSKVGTTIYEMFIKHYTEKQWGKNCSELPSSIMRRIPLRFTFDNNYYSGKQYQGIPIDGYTKIIEHLLEGIDVAVSTDGKTFYNQVKDEFARVIYTGPIDEFFDYKFGILEYRSLRFEEKTYNFPDYQGVAVVNHTDRTKEFTRTIEHQHFLSNPQNHTIVSYEYPQQYVPGTNEPIYPIESEQSAKNYKAYVLYAKMTEPKITFCGR